MVYIADDLSGLRIIDVSICVALRGYYDTLGRTRYSGHCGNFAYLADYENGLTILNIKTCSA